MTFFDIWQHNIVKTKIMPTDVRKCRLTLFNVKKYGIHEHFFVKGRGVINLMLTIFDLNIGRYMCTTCIGQLICVGDRIKANCPHVGSGPIV